MMIATIRPVLLFGSRTVRRRREWRILSALPERSDTKKLALVLGVANDRSIAWACVLSFLRKGYDCIITYQDSATDIDAKKQIAGKTAESKYEAKIKKLVQTTESMDTSSRILDAFPCNVETDLPGLFQDRIQPLLVHAGVGRKVDAVVHSIAYSPEMDKPLLESSASAYLRAQHISAYSFVEMVRECIASNILSDSSAITTLTYLGAVRSVPGYGCMGPAKASLESIVRSLAVEVNRIRGQDENSSTPLAIRINAVSAGPIKTVSARGIPNFSTLQEHVAQTSPLRRNVTAAEVAETVSWLSTVATGITGQTIYVDAGYSSVVPVAVDGTE
jgi:enoyl-[acyl-carrier protein] reductase I